MAIARLSVGTGSKGKASPHAQYIAREGKYAKDSNSQEKLEHTGHDNMPAWAQADPNYFWKMADEHERKNGSTYREHVIALPRELDSDQRHELIKEWIKQEVGDKHAYQYAIHNPPAMDGGEQPHAHIMFSERTRDGIERDPDQYFKRYNGKNPDRGGAKKANTGKKPAERKIELKAQRDRWEQTCNSHLEQAGKYQRISMKSLKEQGIERQPINFTMSQIKKPEIKQGYEALIQAKEEDYQARLSVIGVLEGTALSEITSQVRQAKERKALETKAKTQPIQKQEPTQSPPFEPKPEAKLSKADDIAKKRQFLDTFNQKINDGAKKIHELELEEIRESAKPFYNEIEQLKESKPMNPFKVKGWQQELDSKVEQYRKVKRGHDTKKSEGVTADHKQQSYTVFAQLRPDTFEKLQDMSKEVSAYDEQQAQLERQQQREHLAELRAQRQAQRVDRGSERGMER